MDVTVTQIRAFRLAKQGLHERASDPLDALSGWAIQDSPPGAATAALLARTRDVPVGWLDEALADKSVVSLYNPRTATSIVPAAQAAAFATGLLPQNDAELKFLVHNAVPEQSSDFAEPVELAVDAISDALDRRSLSRDDLHEELRQRLPKALLPWCEGCQSHHAKRWLLVMASLRGRLCISGRVGRQPEFSRTDQWASWKAPSLEQAQRAVLDHYLRAYGPSTAGEFAEWTGTSKPFAKRVWVSASADMTEISVEGEPAGTIWSADRDLLSDPPEHAGVCLLGPGDPLLLGRDRETLIPDAAVRKKLWSSLPTTGLVLADGDGVALWKAKKSGKRLDLTVTPLAKLTRATAAEIERQGECLALHRGAGSVRVTVS